MEPLSESKAEENWKLVEKLIKKLPAERCKLVTSMFEKIGTTYFTAPASAREDYHGCFPGGLCDHSLRVTVNLQTLAKALAPEKYQAEKLLFVGLMHDLGKVGDVDCPLYVPNPSDWHRKKGMLYETNKNLPYMPTCDRTMYLLQKFGITLDMDEYIAIRISDGPYEKSNEKYNMKEPDLALLLHMADRWACAQEKK